MPQTSEAGIVYTNLIAPEVVGPNSSLSFVIDNLPGVARLGFNAHTKPTFISSSRWVTGKQIAGYVRLKTDLSFFALPLPKSVSWDAIPAGTNAGAFVAYWNYSHRFPTGYNDRYFAFKFQDSTQANKLLYGWIHVDVSNPTSGTGPDLVISEWAYDTSGNKLPTGIVPEPNSAALLALGAMALGAPGVRAWRTKRRSAPQR